MDFVQRETQSNGIKTHLTRICALTSPAWAVSGRTTLNFRLCHCGPVGITQPCGEKTPRSVTSGSIAAHSAPLTSSQYQSVAMACRSNQRMKQSNEFFLFILLHWAFISSFASTHFINFLIRFIGFFKNFLKSLL